jgi:predicted dehydrogenase
MKLQAPASVSSLPLTRREALQTSAIAVGFAAAAQPSRANQRASKEKLNIACVGVGGQGKSDMGELAKIAEVNFVALCDVDSDKLAAASKQFPSATTHRDFRQMFETAQNFDAVLVATPDHTHAVITMMALKNRKHVYCEKPLTRTVYEARAIAEETRKAGVVTQMGNQGMATEGNRLIKEWLAAGAIGAVQAVHVWSDRPTHSGKLPLWWSQGVERPKEFPPTPANLDWNLWLGPAPERPFHPIYGPFQWRGWWDFGSGGLGDIGIHNMAPVFDALKLDAPESVHGSSTPVFPESVPHACTVHYQFAARDDRPAVKLHWYDGGIIPALTAGLDEDTSFPRNGGILFVGDAGQLLVSGEGGRQPVLLPKSRDQKFKRPAPTLPRSIGHHAEWVKACREGGTTASNFDFAGPLTEAVLLGSICIRLGGEKLRWNSRQLKFIDNPQADALLHYPYRDGWTL